MKGALCLLSVAVCAAIAGGCDPGPTADSGSTSACTDRHWVGAWTASSSDADGRTLAGKTVRVIATPLLDGGRIRVTLSNRFGEGPLLVERVAIGTQRNGASLDGRSSPLSFDGTRPVRVEAGLEAISDPVRFELRALAPVAVSVDLSPLSQTPVTRHLLGMQTSFIAPGGGAADDPTSRPFTQRTGARYIVSAIDVLAGGHTGRVVAFGDSLTDGQQAPEPSTSSDRNGVNEDARYPDFLARRELARDRVQTAVTNAGIAGNSLLLAAIPHYGPNGLARLQSDVIDEAGVTDVIVLEGLNDLNYVGGSEVIDALKSLIGRLEHADLNVIAGTLMPAPGSSGDRRAVNRWIRTQSRATVVDFDRAVRDPDSPDQLRARFDSGDGLHLSSAGYRAMAQAIDPRMLRGVRCG